MKQRWFPVQDPRTKYWYVLDANAPLDDCHRGELGPFHSEAEADFQAYRRSGKAPAQEKQTP